jgi:hypothetical protein
LTVFDGLDQAKLPFGASDDPMCAQALEVGSWFWQEASVMRQLRVRFSLGTLPCVVAVVAANFAVVRPFLEPSYGNAATEGSIILVGFLPLINAALIGSLRFGARKLRPLFGGPARSAQIAPAAFTYFNLHFLALGGLVALLLPDELDNTLTTVGRYLTGTPDGTFGSPLPDWGIYADILFDVLFVGVLISAPPLICSWISATLARRYAAGVSSSRFRAMACLVSFGFAAVALSTAITPRPFEGDVDVTTEFQVVDRDSGRPIVGALVSATDAFAWREQPALSLATTDSDGRALLTDRLPGHGQSNAFGVTGMFSAWGQWLIVSAPGCQTARIPMPEVLGRLGVVGHSAFRRIVVSKGSTSPAPFCNIGGIYSRSWGMGGSGFDLLLDGRFSWTTGGCRPPYPGEYGTYQVVGRKIVFTAVPHAGEETHPFMSRTYTMIKWGDRTYLAAADDQNLMSFCKEALLPKTRAYYRYSHNLYLCETDKDQPQFGLPRLPLRVWLKFFMSEITALTQSPGAV